MLGVHLPCCVQRTLHLCSYYCLCSQSLSASSSSKLPKPWEEVLQCRFEHSASSCSLPFGQKTDILNGHTGHVSKGKQEETVRKREKGKLAFQGRVLTHKLWCFLFSHIKKFSTAYSQRSAPPTGLRQKRLPSQTVGNAKSEAFSTQSWWDFSYIGMCRNVNSNEVNESNEAKRFVKGGRKPGNCG